MDEIPFHPEALDEYQAALAWYQARGPQAAARFEVEVERALGMISVNPGLFPKYDDDNRFVTLTRFPYSVVYQAKPVQIQVIAIAHSHRAAGYWRGRV